jgi:hypothetical protein
VEGCDHFGLAYGFVVQCFDLAGDNRRPFDTSQRPQANRCLHTEHLQHDAVTERQLIISHRLLVTNAENKNCSTLVLWDRMVTRIKDSYHGLSISQYRRRDLLHLTLFDRPEHKDSHGLDPRCQKTVVTMDHLHISSHKSWRETCYARSRLVEQEITTIPRASQLVSYISSCGEVRLCTRNQHTSKHARPSYNPPQPSSQPPQAFHPPTPATP